MAGADLAVTKEAVAPATERSDATHITRAWVEAFRLVGLTRLIFFFLAYAGAWFLAAGQGPATDGFFQIWERWDARHFFQVADYGYTDPRTDPHATAFFPAFPLLVKALSAVGLSNVLAGLLVTTIASLVASAYLYRLAEEELGEGTGRRAILYLLLFPTAVFLVAPYSESLFLAGAIPAFYYARRSQWLKASLPAAIAMGSRAAGIFLLFGLVVEFFRARDFKLNKVLQAAAALLIGAIPLIAYGAYLWVAKDDPFYFFIDQREGWGREFVSPIRAFVNTWNTWEVATYPTNFIFAWRVEIIAAAAGVGATAWAVAKREWGYAAFMASTMVVLLLNKWYMSIPRMLLAFFPIALFLAQYTKKSPSTHDIVLVCFTPIAALGVVVFTRAAWFY